MSGQDTDENWLVSDPVVAQWLDGETHRPRYLGYSSPVNWKSHLTLNLGLDLSESKREALVWFRLPVRVKSKTAKKPTKFYLYFIIELDMFEVDGEDQGLSFSQPSVPPPVGFAFKGSNICHADEDIIRLRFNLNRPGVVVMPKAEESPFEPTGANHEVLLALRSLSEVTKFNVYLHKHSIQINRLETLCWMVQHGGLTSRPRDLNTLYHGKGGELNAWQNFCLPCGDQSTSTVSTAQAAAEASGSASLIASTSSIPFGEKQTLWEDAKERIVAKTAEKEREANERLAQDAEPGTDCEVPPAYNEVVASEQPRPDVSPTSEPPAQVKELPSRILPPASDRARQSSAPPSFRNPHEERRTSSPAPWPLRALAEAQARRKGSAPPPTTSAPKEKASSSKRPKPPSDDEIEDDDWDAVPTSTTREKERRPRIKPKSPTKSRRPSKQVRFDTPSGPSSSPTSAVHHHRHHRPTLLRHHASFPQPRHHHKPSRPTTPTTNPNPATTLTMTDAARALPDPQARLLRAAIDWLKWAWRTTNRHAHEGPQTRALLLALGHAARVGDEAGFYAARAACSSCVLFYGSGGEEEDEDGDQGRVVAASFPVHAGAGVGGGRRARKGGEGSNGPAALRMELTRFLMWAADVHPEAEVGLTEELREMGRLARAGEREAFDHACAVCAAFVVFRFGVPMVEGEGVVGV